MHFTGLAFSNTHTENRAEKINVGINYKTKALRGRWAQVYDRYDGGREGTVGIWKENNFLLLCVTWESLSPKICPSTANSAVWVLSTSDWNLVQCKDVQTKKTQHHWSDSENPWCRQVIKKVATCQSSCDELTPSSPFVLTVVWWTMSVCAQASLKYSVLLCSHNGFNTCLFSVT